MTDSDNRAQYAQTADNQPEMLLAEGLTGYEFSDKNLLWSALMHSSAAPLPTSTTGEGTLNVNGAGTDAGVFTDTHSPTTAVGDHPGPYNAASTTYTLRQNLETASESSMVHPLFIDGSGHAAEHSNNLNTTLITRAIANLTANGLGSYVISSTNPQINRAVRGTSPFWCKAISILCMAKSKSRPLAVSAQRAE